MDESVIRGLVMGGMLAAAGFVANMIWKMVRSVKASEEGSRRFGLVVRWGFVLGYFALAFSAPEITGVMLSLAAIVGVIYWVRSGMKK